MPTPFAAGIISAFRRQSHTRIMTLLVSFCLRIALPPRRQARRQFGDRTLVRPAVGFKQSHALLPCPIQGLVAAGYCPDLDTPMISAQYQALAKAESS